VHIFSTKNRILHAYVCPNTTTNYTLFYLFISSAGVHLKNSAHLCLISTKMPTEIFFVALWVQLHPLHPLATSMVFLLSDFTVVKACLVIFDMWNLISFIHMQTYPRVLFAILCIYGRPNNRTILKVCKQVTQIHASKSIQFCI